MPNSAIGKKRIQHELRSAKKLLLPIVSVKKTGAFRQFAALKAIHALVFHAFLINLTF